jgi:hypothetical protein
MKEQLLQLSLLLPQVIQLWLIFNFEFKVILCYETDCRQALKLDGINNHLNRKHQVEIKLRQQLTEYLEQWQWQYDFRSVPLPLDRSLPQPVLPILDGFQCRSCTYTTTNRSIIRKHCNIQHGQKRLKDEELFQAVQLQTWFREKRARYWVVDATRQSRDINNSSGSGSGSGSSSSKIEAAADQWEAEIKEKRLKLCQTPQPTEISPWLRFTDWPRILAESQYDLV